MRYYWSSANTIFDLLNSKPALEISPKDFRIIDQDKKKFISAINLTYDVNGQNKIVNTRVKQGVINYVSGDSGSGKTTLLKILSGLQRPISGTVSFPNAETMNSIVYIPQKIGIIEGSVRDNIDFFRTKNLPEMYTQPLNTTGFDQVLRERSISLNSIITEGGQNLSGGQAQRLAISRCLLNNPKVLILDEALSGIHRSDSRQILRALLENTHIFLILTTHDPQILEGFPVNKIAL